MSILADFGAGFFGNLSQQMQRKRELNEKLDEEKRSEKRETARFDRQLAAQREGEDRRLGREVDPSRPAEFNDEAGTVTTYYMDGTSRTRQMTADEKRERQQGIEDRELNSRYKNALIAQMGRSGGRGGSGGNNDMTDSEARAYAIMQVGPEPDKDEDPEAWADWSRRFNGAFLAAKRGIDVAGPSTLRDPTGATVQSGTSILDRIKAEREAALNYTGPASVVRGP